MSINVTITLDADHAAALLRFADKVSHEDAQRVLYQHVCAAVRSDQAYQIIAAFSELGKSLTAAGARSWPWIETGNAERPHHFHRACCSIELHEWRPGYHGASAACLRCRAVRTERS